MFQNSQGHDVQNSPPLLESVNISLLHLLIFAALTAPAAYKMSQWKFPALKNRRTPPRADSMHVNISKEHIYIIDVHLVQPGTFNIDLCHLTYSTVWGRGCVETECVL